MTNPTPLITWPQVPDAEKERLKAREAAQRRETKKRGLPAWPVSVEGLWLVQRGMCTCPECAGQKPLNPFTEAGDDDRIVLAHVYFRAGKGSPGHVPHNVALWPHKCNAREAGGETSALAKGNRMAVNKILAVDRPKEEKRNGSRRQSRGFAGHRKMNGDVVWK